MGEVVELEFTPLEFETASLLLISSKISLEFTPLEFETQSREKMNDPNLN